MSFYNHHLFICNNERLGEKPCCAHWNAKEMYRYAKDRCRERNLLGEGKIGVSITRCLGRCDSGPVAVVYPEGVWYRYFDNEDIDEIIEQHLLGNTPVDRLKID